MEERATQSGNKTTLDATNRLAEAWSQLNAINPESGYELLRTFMDRLQQHPQLHSMVSPKPILKLPEPALSTSNPKPSLSGATLSGPLPVLGAITRTKRANSSSTNNKKKGLRQSSDFGMNGVDDEPLSSTPAGNQLADVLYGRWLEGLRGRWGAIAK